MLKQLKAALYLRVSSSDQHIENQLQPLEQFCKKGYEIARVYAETESAWQAGFQEEIKKPELPIHLARYEKTSVIIHRGLYQIRLKP